MYENKVAIHSFIPSFVHQYFLKWSEIFKLDLHGIGLVLISFFFSDSLFIWTRFNSSFSFEYFTGFWWMTEMSNLCHRITCWFMILCLKCFNYYNLNELHTYKYEINTKPILLHIFLIRTIYTITLSRWKKQPNHSNNSHVAPIKICLYYKTKTSSTVLIVRLSNLVC
jgi:hypothetical protein